MAVLHRFYCNISSLSLTLHTGYFFMLLLSSADFFQNQPINLKNPYRTTIRVTNCLADQDQCSVYLDLVLNCLQRLSVDSKS